MLSVEVISQRTSDTVSPHRTSGVVFLHEVSNIVSSHSAPLAAGLAPFTTILTDLL